MRIPLIVSLLILSCDPHLQVNSTVPNPPTLLVAPKPIPRPVPGVVQQFRATSYKVDTNTCAGDLSLFVVLPDKVDLTGGNPLWGGTAVLSPLLWYDRCVQSDCPLGHRVDCNTEIPWQPTATVYGIYRTLYLNGDLSKPQWYQEHISTDRNSDCTAAFNVMLVPL